MSGYSDNRLEEMLILFDIDGAACLQVDRKHVIAFDQLQAQIQLQWTKAV